MHAVRHEHESTYRSLGADDPLLLRLSRRRPWRAVADAAGCYAVILAAFALLDRFESWWIAALCFVLIGNRQYALSVMAHDGKHGNLLPHRRLNDVFTIALLCAPIGVDFHGEKANHRRHHKLLGTLRDPDLPLYATGNKATRGRFLSYLSGLSIFPRSFANAARSGTTNASRRSFLASFIVYRRHTLAAQAVVLVAITASFPWWYYAVFWIAPIYVLLFAPHKIRMFCEHAQPDLPDAGAGGRRLVTYLPGRLERALLAPMNNNYHAEHHLWPFVPYSNLPALHALLRHGPDIEVRRSYVGFLWSYFRRLPLQPTPVEEALPAR